LEYAKIGLGPSEIQQLAGDVHGPHLGDRLSHHLDAQLLGPLARKRNRVLPEFRIAIKEGHFWSNALFLGIISDVL